MKDNKLNIAIECGADFRMKFTITDDNDQPIDLTGAIVEAQLRQYESAVDYFQFVATHNQTGGTVTMTLPKEVTNLVSYSSGYYDVFVTLAGGSRSRVLHGDVTVKANITKPFDGTMLYMIGVVDYASLPSAGQTNRIYFVYDTGDIYRWNGTTYVLTSVGKGVQSIVVTSVTSDKITFKVTYTDGTTYTFTLDLDLDSRYYTKEMVAQEFKTTKSYAVHDYTIYDGTLYRCTSPHTGAWNASHFTAVDVMTEVYSVLQESIFEVSYSDGDYTLTWFGASASCPYSVSYADGDYILSITLS